ncbi:hypothetical protein RYB01_14940 [Pseudomonas syringae]|nr:hypothetical protein [Pseudomonas syringae]
MLNKSNLIRNRLILAQALLEESDALPGFKGYKTDPDGKVHHPRHEREALVVYLLLTCFDLLGQSRPYLTFPQWLDTKKPEVLNERNKVLEGLGALPKNPIECSGRIFEGYNQLYGATKAFFAGINDLPTDVRAHLMNSISIVGRDPLSLKEENKNTSFPGIPISDETKLCKLKLNYLYSLRNSFTHQLAQVHFSSMPSMSGLMQDLKGTPQDKQVDSASWGVIVYDGEVNYGHHNETDKKYCYSLSGWPFVLFEVLYAAIGEDFKREQIRLNMYALVIGRHFHPSVPHALLPGELKLAYGIIPKPWRA